LKLYRNEDLPPGDRQFTDEGFVDEGVSRRETRHLTPGTFEFRLAEQRNVKQVVRCGGCGWDVKPKRLDGKVWCPLCYGEVDI
jgi:hypothetical protein